MKRIKRLDDLASEVCKKRAGYECEKCGSTKVIQCHHIIPRTKWALRYDLENLICLCKFHHLYWAHKDATAFTAWIETKRDMKYLNAKRNNTMKNDYTLIEIYLKNELKKQL